MKRIISVLLCVLLFFSVCGCAKADNPKPEKDTPTVILPDSKAQQTLNGYKTEDKKEETKQPNITGQYYANKSSKKFHLSSCSYAKSIKETNLLTTFDRASLINDGYKPCAKCNP